MKGLIAVLEDRLRLAIDGPARFGLLADLAIARAQAGDLPRAELAMRSLKSESEVGRFPRYSVYAMICDGVIDYYKNLSLSSHDRLYRASRLALSADDKPLIALSHVWLAHTAFNFQRWTELDSALGTLDSLIAELSAQSAARLALTVADLAQYSGRSESAENWYQRARLLSRVAHDHGLLVAIESNRLILKLDRLRVMRAFGSNVGLDAIPTMRTELASLRAIHQSFGSDSFLELLLWAEATEHEFSGRYAEAALTLRGMLAKTSGDRRTMSPDLVIFEARVFEVLAESVVGNEALAVDVLQIVDRMSDDDALIALGLLNLYGGISGVPLVDAEMHLRFRLLRDRCESELRRLMRLSVDHDGLLERIDNFLNAATRIDVSGSQ